MILINRDQVPTDTGKKLYDLLVKAWEDPEFIYGVLARLRGDTQKQKLIDFIEEENETDSDIITLASLDIADGIDI